MVKVHKRTKNSRLRGSRTAGWGFRQKHKGHGNKGGFGKAGTGKRGDHAKQSTAMSVKGKYFGKQGATSRRTAIAKYEKINLYAVKDNYFRKEGDKIDLAKHKILGMGEGFKATITAKEATASAIAKMEAAGGKIILPEVKADVKQYVVKEKAEVKESEDEDAPENK